MYKVYGNNKVMSEYTATRRPTVYTTVDLAGTFYAPSLFDNPASTTGAFVTFEQHTTDTRRRLDIMGRIAMHEGFSEVSSKPEIISRYGKDLPQVVRGSEEKRQVEIVELRQLNHEKELAEAGFDLVDIKDTSTQLNATFRAAYMGPENKAKRAKLKRKLDKKLQKTDIW